MPFITIEIQRFECECCHGSELVQRGIPDGWCAIKQPTSWRHLWLPIYKTYCKTCMPLNEDIK
jgi:hypothetical protein